MQQYYKPPSAWRDQSLRRPRPPDILRVFSFRTSKFSKRAGPGERGEVSLSTQWRKVVLCILDNCTCVLLVKCVLEVLEWWCRAWHWHRYWAWAGPAWRGDTSLVIKTLNLSELRHGYLISSSFGKYIGACFCLQRREEIDLFLVGNCWVCLSFVDSFN